MIDAKKLMTEANAAAQAAAQKWLDDAVVRYVVRYGPNESKSSHMLDLCGGAYLMFNDKRKADFKAFAQGGLVRFDKMLDVSYDLRSRQEHGLHCAAAHAAAEVLKAGGVNVTVKDYID